jgi:hypothetical protein
MYYIYLKKFNMDDMIIQANLLTRMNITNLDYQQCLIKNQDNIFKLIDRLNEIEQLYNSVLIQNQTLTEENKELKKNIRQLEMDNNVLYFDLQYYKPSQGSSDGPDLSISE